MNTATESTTTAIATSKSTNRWPLERILFAMAGTMTLLSALLATVVSPWFLLVSLAVGINQWLYAALRTCPASIILKRLGVHQQCTS